MGFLPKPQSDTQLPLTKWLVMKLTTKTLGNFVSRAEQSRAGLSCSLHGTVCVVTDWADWEPGLTADRLGRLYTVIVIVRKQLSSSERKLLRKTETHITGTKTSPQSGYLYRDTGTALTKYLRYSLYYANNSEGGWKEA